MTIDIDKVHLYIDNKLSDEDKISFENELDNNDELQLLLNDLKLNNYLLKHIPKHRTDSNFMVKLNDRIDAYESGHNKWYSPILEKLSGYKATPMFATLSLVFIISFTTYKIASNNNLSYSSKNNYSEKDMMAINDDSLTNSSDSLYQEPTLLISNDK